MSRRPPPDLLDPLSAADRMADAWLAERGVRWRWPRMQGAQLDAAAVAVWTSKRPNVQTPEATHEARETLTALRAGGLIDAGLRRADAAAPPATCGDAHDDAPALPVAAAAELAGCSRRTVQVRMQGVAEIEAAGQLVLPCVPPVAEVYKVRTGKRLDVQTEEVGHGC